MGNKGAYITFSTDLQPEFTTYEAVVSCVMKFVYTRSQTHHTYTHIHTHAHTHTHTRTHTHTHTHTHSPTPTSNLCNMLVLYLVCCHSDRLMIEIHVFIVVLKLIMIPCLFIFIEYMVQMILLILILPLCGNLKIQNIDELMSKRMQVHSFHR